MWKNWHMIFSSLFVCEALLINHWQYFSECRTLSLLWIFKCKNVKRGNLDVPLFSSSKPSVRCVERVTIKCVSKFASSSRRSGPLTGMLFPCIHMNHVSKAWLTFSYMQTFTPYLFFFYLGFLSWTFTIYRTTGERGGYLLNSSLPLPPASQTFRH